MPRRGWTIYGFQGKYLLICYKLLWQYAINVVGKNQFYKRASFIFPGEFGTHLTLLLCL